MTALKHRQSKFQLERRRFQQNGKAQPTKEFYTVVTENELVAVGNTLLFPSPLGYIASYRQLAHERRHSFWHTTYFLVCLSVMVSLLYVNPTCQAFQNHWNHPNHQRVREIQHHNFRRGYSVNRESTQIYSLNDISIDDGAVDAKAQKVNSLIDIDHTIEPRSLPSTISIWESLAFFCVSRQYNIPTSNDRKNTDEDDITRFVSTYATPEQLYDYTQYISVLRVMIPSLGYATITKFIYPSIAMWVASLLQGEPGVFAVVSQDASQFIQNVCTTSGLAFSILIGQTYYFMYQQQEKIYYAIYDEVAMAKMVLEQISLISRGRPQLYETILQQMDRYVRDDLQQMNDIDPAMMLSSRPCDDPLEDILYLTSVGEPSQIYQSIRSLRQARAQRLGSLQMKLPEIQMTLLWILSAIVLLVFPLLGAGSQTIGGFAILQVQSWYLSFLVFGISLVMGIIYELRSPNQPGAYNARTILSIMISGLQEELQERLQYTSTSPSALLIADDAIVGLTLDDSNVSTTNFAYFDASPSIDGDGSF